MRQLAIAATALALLAAGCGGDEESDEPAARSDAPAATEAAPATTEQAPPAGGEGGEDAGDAEAAIRETVVTWLLEGPCELMSDRFLEEQAILGDTRAERCEFFGKARTTPQYGEDDIVTSGFKIDGDRASVVISDHISNVETTFNLVREDGRWVIDGTDL